MRRKGLLDWLAPNFFGDPDDEERELACLELAERVTAVERKPELRNDEATVAGIAGLAVEIGHRPTVELVASWGVDMTQVASVVLCWAVSTEGRRRIQWAVELGADVNRRSDEGDTPLEMAVLWDGQMAQGAEDPQFPWTELILQFGADLEAEGKNFQTPLSAAAALGYREAVEFLIARGAQVSVADIDGDSPRDLADEYGHHELAEILLEHELREMRGQRFPLDTDDIAEARAAQAEVQRYLADRHVSPLLSRQLRDLRIRIEAYLRRELPACRLRKLTWEIRQSLAQEASKKGRRSGWRRPG